MSRILKRPMFRTGGTPNQGIMNGIVDRKGYAQGDNPYIQEAKEALRTDAPRDTSFYEMAIGGGMNLVSGAGAGDGLMANIAKSYKGPSEDYFKAQRARSDYDRKLQQTAGQMGLEQKWKMELKGDENSPLYNVYLQQGVERGMSGAEAQRFAAYHTDIQDKLRQKVGSNLIGGIIEDNFNTLSEKQKRKKISKLKQTGMGKYFYDPYDGKIKQLVEMDGQLQWRAFDSVDSIDFSPVSGSSTETSTPYQDEVEAREIEKQEGNILDEDIAAIRGY
jgi:hypothetical protein